MKILETNFTKNQWIAIAISMAFVILNSIFIASEFFFLSIFPALLFVGLLYFTRADLVLILISFLTPLAVNLSSFDLDIGVSIPTEPLLAALLVLIIAKILYDREFDKRILIHPISIVIYLYLIWMLLCTFTSEFPIVSLKAFIAKLWFIIPLYFFGIQAFRKEQNMWYFIYAYIFGFLIVIFYTLINHAINAFSSEAAHWVMTPFYNDHTSYGAMLAMFIPILSGFLFIKDYSSSKKFLIFTLLIIFVVAIIFSISRAAWASVLAAFGIWFLIYFKIKFRWIFSIAAIVFFIGFAYKGEIIQKLERNKQDAKGGLVQHVESVSNVATDASNLERINRWSSAIGMFKKRPVFGYGPGTYQFIYAPFQHSYEKTVISTNAGNRGTAHSEYLLVLSEEGLLGGICLISIFILIIITAVKNNKNVKNSKIRLLNMIVMLGIFTYLFHAIFNNFLDTDKAAVPFWGLTAIITSINIYHLKTFDAKIPI